MTRRDIQKKQEEIDAMISCLMKQKKYQEIVELKRTSEELSKQEYNLMSFDEKVTYWAKGIHDSMRSYGEQGHDEMLIFSKEEYQIWKVEEPNINALLPEILKRLNINPDEVYSLLGIKL